MNSITIIDKVTGNELILTNDGGVYFIITINGEDHYFYLDPESLMMMYGLLDLSLHPEEK